jgi:hypothetical protein
MKQIIKLIVFCLVLCASLTVEAQKIKSLKSINWLAGRWECEGKKGNIYEEWKTVDEQKMEGRSFRVYKKDTTFNETMQIVIEGQDLFYIATVKDQNNGEAVRFKMSDGNSMHMTFENKEHDFPQLIKYQWKQNNHFNAEVSGLIKGKKKSQIYIYNKLK